MKIVNTYHSPTSVSSSLKCRLTSDPACEFLVVARTNELDVFAILSHGLRLQCSLDVWGRITSLKATGSRDETSVSLILTTDHPDPRLLLLQYVASHPPRLECIKSISLQERNSRPAEFFCGTIIDSSGDIAIVSSYVGKLKVLEFSNGKYNSDFDTSIRELNILAMTFLQTVGTRSSTIAFLHRDFNQRIVLVSHELCDTENDLSILPSSVLPETFISDPSASVLIPVPPFGGTSWNALGGVLVLGNERISFFSNAKKSKKKLGDGKPKPADGMRPAAELRWSYSQVTAWARIDEQGSRYLLGDSFGKLVLLSLSTEATNDDRLYTLFLGETSAPTSLTVLPSQFVYVGSHFGDSQLVLIEPSRGSDSSHIQVVDHFKNIAPIVDAVLVNDTGTGQNEIVTCSGGQNTGSLRIIRNGVNFVVDARIDGIRDVVAIWPLKSHSQTDYDTYLLVSTPSSSYLYELPNDLRASNLSRLSEEEYPGFDFTRRTIAVSNIVKRSVNSEGKSTYEGSSYVVQVTGTEVSVINMATRNCESRWSPQDKQVIILADITPSQVCVALAGGTIVLLRLTREAVEEIGSMIQNKEISAIAFSRARRNTPSSTRLAVGYWDDFEVRVYCVPSLDSFTTMGKMTGLPRSLLIIDFEEGKTEEGKTVSRRHLVVGQADGRVVMMPYEKSGIEESDKRIIALGDSPVTLSKCDVDGRSTVLASGMRSALLSWKNNGVFVSSLLLKDTTAAATLKLPASRSSTLAMATEEGLTMGKVLHVERLHIRTIPMGLDNPVRLAYQADTRMFGIGRITSTVLPGTELQTCKSSFIVMDAVNYALSHSIQLHMNEEITAVEAVKLSTDEGLLPLFAVGTMYYNAGDKEPTQGRVMLFSVSSGENRPAAFCVSETTANGCVFSFACMQGHLVAAINSRVHLYSLRSNSKNSKDLIELTEWSHNYLVTSIATDGDKLVAGDAVSSIALLQLEGNKFKTVARDYGPIWPLCISVLQGSIIGSNSDNLFSFKVQKVADKLILDQDGEFRINEIVNKIVLGRINSQCTTKSEIFVPSNIFFSSSGRIGVIVDSADKTQSMNLTCLLRNLASLIKGPGQVTYEDLRSPVSARGKSDGHPIQGFIDGDFLERFLDFDPSSQEAQKILRGQTTAEKLQLTSQQIKSMLESLRDFH